MHAEIQVLLTIFLKSYYFEGLKQQQKSVKFERLSTPPTHNVNLLQ